MANPSANNNGTISNGNGTTAENNNNGGCSAVPEESTVGPSELALKHKISLSKNWSSDEQSLLEELLTKYASDSKIMCYAKIAPKLQDKTVRDVALRYKWMTAMKQMEPYVHLLNPRGTDDPDIYFEDIGGESWQLLEENAQAMKQISANFSALKANENINLLLKIRNNIEVLSKESLNDMSGMMEKMPPVPINLNDQLANSIIPQTNAQ